MYSFKAKVIRGKGRGTKIGFPTINLDKKNLDIERGVYLVEIIYNKKVYKGLLHFGEKKTFREEISVEIYIQNFNLNIYGQSVIINILEKIRKIKTFKTVDELKKQIKKDLKYV